MSAIAIVGASSQIAKDLIRSFAVQGRRDLLLYVRHLDTAHAWVREHGLDAACSVHGYDAYGELPHDAVINFVGVGDPRRAAEMGASIFDITTRFDDMVLAGLERNPQRRYLFLSSGAAYGNAFSEPVTADTQAQIAINRIHPQDYYATAKLHAEVRHRSRSDLAIVDLRVFNCFSRTQDIEARFFITDIVRAIRDERTLQTSADYMVRDFLHPGDFHQLVARVLAAPAQNCAVDCYTRAPVDKPTLLQAMAGRFGLRYEVSAPDASVAVNATGAKPYYYSLNRKAAEFGYQPAYSSLDCVLTETAALLG
jgi:nucleoside-diphosphate-sugar epimerase